MYKERFLPNILWHRAWQAVHILHASSRGRTGRACVHDCGPHASCRCGLCVSGGDDNTCLLPNCGECHSRMFTYLQVFAVALVVSFFSFIAAALRVLRSMNNRSHQNCMNLNICEWFCLCDANLFWPSRHRRTICGWGRIPPMIHLAVSLLLLGFVLEWMWFVFGDLINDIYAIIPEELYPSDHLVLSATLNI